MYDFLQGGSRSESRASLSESGGGQNRGESEERSRAGVSDLSPERFW